MSTRASIKPVASFLFAAMLACPAAVLAQTSGGGGDYGDLFVLDRDADGVPILTAERCQQPIAAAADTFTILDQDGEVQPCNRNSTGEFCLIPVDPITCAVLVDYASHTQEIDFGRMSVARAPADVMDKQLADVVVNLTTADCITLDPAGRLVYTMQDVNDSNGNGDVTEYLSATVDSPLQNLAIYKEMILKGQVGDPAIVLPKPFEAYGFLDTAAKGLGAASDKDGSISLDLVVYLNQILGLSDLATPTVLPKICIDVRQEVKGVVQLVNKCFLNYGEYDYLRSETYSSLPYPAYIPMAAPQDGWFEYLALFTGASGPAGEPLFWIVTGPILPVVFPNAVTPLDETDFLPGFVDGNIGGLAQAADDARAVIEFMHSHPVLTGYETTFECSTPHVTAYDVSISPESGLQVPKRMVFGTVREGTVTVANAGPDAATGSVTVIGLNPTGWPVVVPQTFSFLNLAAGASQSFTFPITITVSFPPNITWTATVTAEFDVLPANNTVTATTKVVRATP